MTPEYFLASGGLRLWEMVIYSSLWVLIGCFIAAIFRRMLGREKVCRIFGNHTRWRLVIGWFIGMLLPVCSLGVIPIVRELHRAGVKRGTIVAFGLTAPLFNPMSVLYGLTLSDPIAILSFSLCALVIVSMLGLVWDAFLTEAVEKDLTPEKLPTPGIKRSFSVFYSAAKEIVGPSLGYIAFGILGSVLLAVLLPKGYLQNQVEHDNLVAPVFVALVATPIYSTPLLAMSQIGGMFQHGNSIGGAFSLLILGAGMNAGLLLWFGMTYGAKRVILFYVLLFATTVGLAYIINTPLYPEGVDPAGHSHAFDVYTNPFAVGQSRMSQTAVTKGIDFWNANDFGGTYLLAGAIVFGLLLRVIPFDFETWFRSPGKVRENKIDRDVPGWLLGVTVVTGLIVASVMGCYLYYQDVEGSLGDLSAVNNEAVYFSKQGDFDSADKWIGYSDDLSRRLEVGVFLRKGAVGEFQTEKAKYYRAKLDELKAACDERNKEKADELSMQVYEAYLSMARAFRDSDK